MNPQGYAIVLDHLERFVLRYYQDVNNESMFVEVAMSYSYDEIMRKLINHRELVGMGKEYWIS
jgi:hypothetical protein